MHDGLFCLSNYEHRNLSYPELCKISRIDDLEGLKSNKWGKDTNNICTIIVKYSFDNFTDFWALNNIDSLFYTKEDADKSFKTNIVKSSYYNEMLDIISQQELKYKNAIQLQDYLLNIEKKPTEGVKLTYKPTPNMFPKFSQSDS